jgi:PAS domain S-box-containing protein
MSRGPGSDNVSSERAARGVAALTTVAEEFRSRSTEEAVYDRAVEAGHAVLGADGCVVYAEEEGHLVPEAWPVDGPDPMPEYVAWERTEEGVLGAVHAGEEPRVVTTDGDVEALGLEDGEYGAALAVPVGDRGVLQAVAVDPETFDEATVDLAVLLAEQLANALDRVEVAGENRVERDRFRALFENVPEPVVEVEHGDAAVVRAVNPAFEETFGYEADRVVGDPLDEHVLPLSRSAREEAAEIAATVRDGEPLEREVQRRTDDGLRTFLLSAVPVGAGREQPRSFYLFTDLTDRKQRRRRVEVLNRVLRHDLRNDMNVVKGTADVLRERVDEDLRDHVDAIAESADDLLDLVEKTREVERAADRWATSTARIDLAAVVEHTAADLGEQYPDAEIAATTPESAPVDADEFVAEAIRHLVENAVVHNDRRPEVEVRLSPHVDGESYLLRVADNGPGLPEDQRELLENGREITQLRHAEGLGLWFVHWTVTQAGGELEFADNDPRGTVVSLTIPMAGDDGETGSAPDAGSTAWTGDHPGAGAGADED